MIKDQQTKINQMIKDRFLCLQIGRDPERVVGARARGRPTPARSLGSGGRPGSRQPLTVERRLMLLAAAQQCCERCRVRTVSSECAQNVRASRGKRPAVIGDAVWDAVCQLARAARSGTWPQARGHGLEGRVVALLAVEALHALMPGLTDSPRRVVERLWPAVTRAIEQEQLCALRLARWVLRAHGFDDKNAYNFLAQAQHRETRRRADRAGRAQRREARAL